ncbi:hypothetical protein CSAL01_11021 [Colletotrichum salicis]|uniref:Uncharacterized protein n=1 Tax=Colletotrichum salicis TaxID=1209931 RepID=A0A135TYI4_9PEZI|nr:hypothetical protein CSAL01_11021 [Colletotrichum salicis]
MRAAPATTATPQTALITPLTIDEPALEGTPELGVSVGPVDEPSPEAAVEQRNNRTLPRNGAARDDSPMESIRMFHEFYLVYVQELAARGSRVGFSGGRRVAVPIESPISEGSIADMNKFGANSNLGLSSDAIDVVVRKSTVTVGSAKTPLKECDDVSSRTP